MPPDESHSDRTAVGVVGLLRRGCWAPVPIGTIESLIAGGRVVEFPSGQTVYTEADAEGLAVVLHGLLRVYMNVGDGRQVTVRYVRAGDLLGVPALIGGPAPVFVQAVTHGSCLLLRHRSRQARGAERCVVGVGTRGGVGSPALRRPGRACRKYIRVGPPARGTPPPRPRGVASGSERPH